MAEYSVLFVCTANRCRSPMAEGIWRQYIRDRNEQEQWAIASAGTWASPGQRTMPFTEQVLSKRRIAMTRHSSQSVERPLLASFSLILVMERGHKEALQAEFPDLQNRVFLLSEMVGRQFDIQDPVAGTMDDYEYTITEIERLLLEGEERIRELAVKDRW